MDLKKMTMTRDFSIIAFVLCTNSELQKLVKSLMLLGVWPVWDKVADNDGNILDFRLLEQMW
jgi:hypothetical protein